MDTHQDVRESQEVIGGKNNKGSNFNLSINFTEAANII